MARLPRALLGFVTSMVLWGCGGAGSPAETAPPAAASAPVSLAPVASQSGPTVAPIPTPGITSTTVEADEAPAGAITVSVNCFDFTPKDITATAGTLVFFLANEPVEPCVLAHNMVIGPPDDETLAKSRNVDANKSAVFTVEGLQPGTYTFWCSVDNHGENFAMTGTLTVEAN